LLWMWKAGALKTGVSQQKRQRLKDPDNGENIFAQQKLKGMVNENYLLLDNQSRVNQIANPNMLKNIRKTSKPIKIHCNAGMSKTELEGELGGMTVYHNSNGIANVLSLKSVVENTGSLTIGGPVEKCDFFKWPQFHF
jgi:hypothetical protein